MKKYFSSHSVSSVKDPECLLVKQSSSVGVINVSSYSMLCIEVKRTVLVTALCSTPALANYSESKLLPMGTAALEVIVNGKKVRGGRRYQMIDNIMISGLYEDMKRKAEKRVEWRMLSLQ